jgi:hypothetical protein
MWLDKIKELEEYFNSVTLPETIELTPYIKVIDVPKFVESHLATVKNYSGNARMKPYLYRLMKLKNLIEIK